MGRMKREFEEAREAITKEFGAWLDEEQCIMIMCEDEHYFDTSIYHQPDPLFEDEENLDF
jgi:hypothetical protein